MAEMIGSLFRAALIYECGKFLDLSQSPCPLSHSPYILLVICFQSFRAKFSACINPLLFAPGTLFVTENLYLTE